MYACSDLEQDLGVRFANWMANTPKAIVGYLRNKATLQDVGIFQALVDSKKGESDMVVQLRQLWEKHQQGKEGADVDSSGGAGAGEGLAAETRAASDLSPATPIKSVANGDVGGDVTPREMT